MLYNQLSEKTRIILEREKIDKNEIEAILKLENEFISLNVTRENEDYEIGNRFRTERLVLKPFYRIRWDNENGSGSAYGKTELIFDDAIQTAEVSGNFDDNDNYYNEISIYLKEVWVDADGDTLEDIGEEQYWSDYAYSNKQNPLVQAIGVDWNYTRSFGAAEDTADELRRRVELDIFDDIEGEYELLDGQKFSIRAVRRGSWGAGKYNTLKVQIRYKNEVLDIGYIELRIADHSYNPRNVTADYFFSITIANRDATSGRFYGIHNLDFDGDADYAEIVSASKEKIEELVAKMDREKSLESRAIEEYVEDESITDLTQLALLKKAKEQLKRVHSLKRLTGVGKILF
jgi:hypothetical protein